MSPSRIILTGATGGLGSSVLRHTVNFIDDPSRLIVSLYNPHKSSESITSLGVEVRKGDYSRPETLDDAYAGADVLFLVSYPSIAHAIRVQNHVNAIDAAKRAGVRHIFYTSLGFAGPAESSESRAAVMRAHIDTEAYLKQSGLTYTIIREGIYSESYPLYLGFFDPSSGSERIAIPQDGNGGIAWVSRDELGEGTARLLVQAANGDLDAAQFNNKTILFSGPAAISLSELAAILSRLLDRPLRVDYVGEEEYATSSLALARLGPDFARLWATTYPALANGECAVVDSLLEEVLGRKRKDMETFLADILRDAGSAQESIDHYAK